MQTFWVLFGLVACTAAYATLEPFRTYKGSKTALTVGNQIPKHMKIGLDLCPTCIQFAGEAINELVNIILSKGSGLFVPTQVLKLLTNLKCVDLACAQVRKDLGVVGECGKVCTALEQKTGSKALGLVCDLLCDAVGIDEFIKLVEKADLDPFYFCELAKICPVFDNGDATITELSVSPFSGPQGPKTIAFSYTTKNGTGTGEIVVEVLTVDGLPLENGFIHDQQPAGSYPGTINLKAEKDPNCDPTQGFCEEWLPGNYTVVVAVCYGECGSAHPHSKIYDKKQTGFIITAN